MRDEDTVNGKDLLKAGSHCNLWRWDEVRDLDLCDTGMT